MSEEILKIGLRELLETIRLRIRNGPVIEAAGTAQAAEVCQTLPRTVDADQRAKLVKLFEQFDAVMIEDFPVEIDFSVRLGRNRPGD